MRRIRILALVATTGTLAGGSTVQSQTPAVPAVESAAPTTPITGAEAGRATAGSRAEVMEGCEVIARIDGQIVQACEVMWRVEDRMEKNQAQIAAMPPEQQKALREFFTRMEIAQLVDTKLLYDQFVRGRPAENIQTINEKLQEPFENDYVPRLLEQFDCSDTNELDLKLISIGTSLRDMRQSYREQAIATQWLRSNIDFSEEVTHQEMLDYYNEHATDYDFPTQARWEELMVRKNRFNHPRQAYAKLCEMAKAVLQSATASGVRGPAFGEVARADSDGFTAENGGLQDWTTKGALRSQAIDQALFSLQVGQMSRIIESDSGFHVVRVLERKEAGRTPFREVQNDIAETIKKERFSTAVSGYIAKLRKNAHIWTVYTGTTNVDQIARPPEALLQTR